MTVANDARTDRRGAIFAQEGPRLTNTYRADATLVAALRRLLPEGLHAELVPEWDALGEAAAGPLAELARQAEAEPPVHVPYDAWGRRVDEVRTSRAWTELHREAARWGLTAVPYEGRLGPHARLHQMALLLLYGPSSAIYSCPLAMTDGAARTLQQHDAALAARAVPRLTSRDPEALWTSGQWMTETTGGSDVSGTSTVAVRGDDGLWRLTGTKWFTSAVTADMALTLARTEGTDGGSRGLSLFYVELRRPDGSRNGVRILRLKDKLGTRALPTAELELEGCLAEPVGALGSGVKKITPLLNVTRMHNAVSACGMMARVLQLLRDYAARRVAFSRPLAAHPLHVETLAALHVDHAAALALTADVARLLGRVEAGEASGDERGALRLLTPLAKLATAKQAVAVASEALEGFGGAGYVEDTGLPVWLRDAQVLPIWEGTTNVLSLDVLRALAREDALGPWAAECSRRLERVGNATEAVEVGRRVERLLDEGRTIAETGEAQARAYALALASTAAAVALAEQAAFDAARGEPRGPAVLRRWLARPFVLPERNGAGDAALLAGLT